MPALVSTQILQMASLKLTNPPRTIINPKWDPQSKALLPNQPLRKPQLKTGKQEVQKLTQP